MYTNMYKVYTDMYKIYTKYHVTARRRWADQAPRRPGRRVNIMYIFIYIYIYIYPVHIHIHTYIYMYVYICMFELFRYKLLLHWYQIFHFPEVSFCTWGVEPWDQAHFIGEIGIS